MEARELKSGDVVPSGEGQMLVVERDGALTKEPLGNRPEPNCLVHWTATALDCTEWDMETHLTYERVNERGGGRSVHVWINGRDKPIHAACVPENGESIHLFTRRGIFDALTPRARQVNMPVLEVRRTDGTFSRIYIHPEHGVVFSTMDLNL